MSSRIRISLWSIPKYISLFLWAEGWVASYDRSCTQLNFLCNMSWDRSASCGTCIHRTQRELLSSPWVSELLRVIILFKSVNIFLLFISFKSGKWGAFLSFVPLKFLAVNTMFCTNDFFISLSLEFFAPQGHLSFPVPGWNSCHQAVEHPHSIASCLAITVIKFSQVVTGLSLIFFQIKHGMRECWRASEAEVLRLCFGSFPRCVIFLLKIY